MKNDYGYLDNLLTAVAFRRPPIKVGEYTVLDDFGDRHRYHFRRMPRARRYTGRYGLFYHHPDAHWLLVGYVDDGGNFQRPVDLLKEYESFLNLFLRSKRTLDLQRCAWCGRVMETGNTDDVHRSETCRNNLKES